MATTNDKKIKILMVMGNTRMGGVQAFILNVLQNIDLNKFQIDIAINFYAEQNGIENECRKYGCKFYILPYFKLYNYCTFKRAWRKFLLENSYDIVYAHATNSASIFLKEAKSLGIKTIAHSHSAGYRGGIVERFVKKIFAKNVGKFADYWFACSEIAAKRLYGTSYHDYKNYYLIPNAINVDKYLFNSNIRNEIRRQLNIDDSVLLCGHVGTFSRPKNHKFLIDIFTEISHMKSNVKLLCCGAGSLMEDVKEYAKKCGVLDNIIFAGVVNNVHEYMMAMDIFIFPSIFEGFPVSILECQSAGLPITMSDTITSEVDLSDLVCRKSLTQSAHEWAETAIRKRSKERCKYNAIIGKTQYNIKTSISVLESLFDKLLNE